MERVDVGAGPRVEAEVELGCRRRRRDDVDVREARAPLALVQLRDPERREHRLVEQDAACEVAYVDVEVVDDRPRPVPIVRVHSSDLRNARC